MFYNHKAAINEKENNYEESAVSHSARDNRAKKRQCEFPLKEEAQKRLTCPKIKQ